MSPALLRALGPGLLFAGAAVGVSHIVQSTRAGAAFGLSLVGLVVLANVFKYAAFSFGPRYAAATGTSLLEGYRRQGRIALSAYGLLTLSTMFTVQAAVTLVTAGLAKAVFGLELSVFWISVLLLVLCASILTLGKYAWLDRIVRVVVVVLTLSTFAATILVLPRVDWSTLGWLPPGELDKKTIFFMAALVGWMPSAIDISVWHSLWTLARREQTGHEPSMEESKLDFDIGYIGTALLALCFIVLGAGVMHGTGTTFANTAGGFAGQVVQLYSSVLGTWSTPIIGSAALLVMFSTTLTVTDGFPRAVSTLVARFRSEERPGSVQGADRAYWVVLAVLMFGAAAVIGWLLTSLKLLVDVATTLSFLTAPILSFLNHRAVLGEEVTTDKRPGAWLLALSTLSIIVQAVFAVYWMWLKFFSA
ncbi:MAG: divalent metal cation transporter [Myxococcota bacterium]|nr:divalent metal cation transporter [Myxococcota bacterium]